MKLRELLPRNRVYSLEEGAKKRLDYSIDAVWKFKTTSAIRFAADTVSANVARITEGAEMDDCLMLCNGNARAARVLLEENRRRLEQGQEPLTPDSDEAKAYAHYICQTIQKSRFAAPRWDDWDQTFYESNGGYSDIMPGVDIPRALTGLVTNYEEVQTLFTGKEGERKEEISEILENGNLFIVSNHCTWLNLPLIVSSLHIEHGIPLNRINTVLGPALTTYEQGLGVAGVSNLIKTIPETPNGRLDQVAPDLQKRVRRASLRKIMKIMSGKGQVLVMSPGGTTDRVTKEAIELLEASRATQGLVKLLAKKNHVWPIATHTGALYAGQKIRAGRFRFFEDGILPPDNGENAIRKLKYNMRALNPEREVKVMEETEYTQQ